MFNSFWSYYLTVCLSWPEVLPVLLFSLCICDPFGWANCSVNHGHVVSHQLLFSLCLSYSANSICKLFTFQYSSVKLYSIRDTKHCYECSLTIYESFYLLVHIDNLRYCYFKGLFVPRHAMTGGHNNGPCLSVCDTLWTQRLWNYITEFVYIWYFDSAEFVEVVGLWLHVFHT